MPECSDGERKMLDRIQRADVIWLYEDDGRKIFSWVRGFNERPPGHFTIDYGHLDGERMVRRVQLTLGLTAKQFDAAVKRGQKRDASIASSEMGERPPR